MHPREMDRGAHSIKTRIGYETRTDHPWDAGPIFPHDFDDEPQNYSR